MSTTAAKRLKTPFQPVGRWIRPARRLAIYQRDNFTCLICERNLADVKASEITLDHVVPRKHGGGNESSNLFTACRPCNSRRRDEPISNLPLPAWFRIVTAILKSRADLILCSCGAFATWSGFLPGSLGKIGICFLCARKRMVRLVQYEAESGKRWAVARVPRGPRRLLYTLLRPTPYVLEELPS